MPMGTRGLSAHDMDIRALLPPPWPLLTPLMEASRKEGFRFLLRLEQEYRSGQVCFDAAGETLLGAFEDSALVAVGGLTRDSYGEDPRSGRVRHLYVLPEWRGRGIGRMLMAEIERRAGSQFRALVLRTDTVAGARFYQALGYELLPAGGTATHRRSLIQE